MKREDRKALNDFLAERQEKNTGIPYAERGKKKKRVVSKSEFDAIPIHHMVFSMVNGTLLGTPVCGASVQFSKSPYGVKLPTQYKLRYKNNNHVNCEKCLKLLEGEK